MFLQDFDNAVTKAKIYPKIMKKLMFKTDFRVLKSNGVIPCIRVIRNFQPVFMSYCHDF